MRIPQNTSVENRPEPARADAVRYRRRVERAEMADWEHAIRTAPATDRTQATNVRHS